jgi:hypothetical protein
MSLLRLCLIVRHMSTLFSWWYSDMGRTETVGLMTPRITAFFTLRNLQGTVSRRGFIHRDVQNKRLDHRTTSLNECDRICFRCIWVAWFSDVPTFQYLLVAQEK